MILLKYFLGFWAGNLLFLLFPLFLGLAFSRCPRFLGCFLPENFKSTFLNCCINLFSHVFMPQIFSSVSYILFEMLASVVTVCLPIFSISKIPKFVFFFIASTSISSLEEFYLFPLLVCISCIYLTDLFISSLMVSIIFIKLNLRLLSWTSVVLEYPGLAR